MLSHCWLTLCIQFFNKLPEQNSTQKNPYRAENIENSHNSKYSGSLKNLPNCFYSIEKKSAEFFVTDEQCDVTFCQILSSSGTRRAPGHNFVTRKDFEDFVKSISPLSAEKMFQMSPKPRVFLCRICAKGFGNYFQTWMDSILELFGVILRGNFCPFRTCLNV